MCKLSELNFNSIYIPRMKKCWDIESITNIFENNGLGVVKHVDFINITKKKGFGENVDDVVKSAFVHFSYISIDSYFYDHISKGDPYTFQIKSNEYWICLKNKNPNKKYITFKNPDKISEQKNEVEYRNENYEKEIIYLREKTSNLEKNIDNLNKVVCHLIGGLYCHDSQTKIMEYHLDTIGHKILNVDIKEKDTNEFGFWPTTRQGDQNTKRIEEIERKINYLENGMVCDMNFEEINEELYRRKHKQV